MNTLKAIQNYFPPDSFSQIRPSKYYSRRRFTPCFSNSANSGSRSSFTPDEDKRKQELLAQIANLQAQKVWVTEFLDERSEHLTKFAEEANAGFDAIGESALKELDDAGKMIVDKLDSRMVAFEEIAAINRQEMEKNEKMLKELEEKIVRDRNEGLFFKNLRQTTPRRNIEAKAEEKKLKQVVKENAGSKTRRSIYLALMSLLILAIANSFFPSNAVEWRKVAGQALILIGLLIQFIYEQSISSKSDKIDEDE
ncbi:hypothetical protein HPP92_013926 [Vanilla planifolia]|uniref:Uncharacterized protein n=1 Tax=Vanilla planifolia TaxID=51239 RepID=A0A835R2X5_VANPL|nr:hypothetical protein HPP92_013926 [Vanilla planifolia]